MDVRVASISSLLLIACVCQEPPKCCLSRQFTAVLSDLNTVSTDAIVNRNLQVDFDRQEESLQMSTVHPSTKRETDKKWIIRNYRTGIQYVILNDEQGPCYKSMFNSPMAPNCIPDNALYLHTNYLGPLTGGLRFNSWRFQYPGTNANLTMGFSEQGCVPIIESIKGNLSSNTYVDNLFLFVDFVPAIQNPGAFNVPPSCPK